MLSADCCVLIVVFVVAGWSLFVVCCWQRDAGGVMFVVRCSLFVVRCLSLFVVCCLLCAVRWLVSVACLWIAVRCVLFVVCYVFFFLVRVER